MKQRTTDDWLYRSTQCKTTASASASTSAPARLVSHLATEQQQSRLGGHCLVSISVSWILTAASLVKVVHLGCPRLYLATLCRTSGVLMLSISASTILSCTVDGAYTVAFNIWEDYQLATETQNELDRASIPNPWILLSSAG